MSTIQCTAPADDIEPRVQWPDIGSGMPHLPERIGEVAAKLAVREGRNDTARDTEIMGWCREAAMQFADAPIQAYVPLLVERIVGDRIRGERGGTASAAPVATDRSARLQPYLPPS